VHTGSLTPLPALAKALNLAIRRVLTCAHHPVTDCHYGTALNFDMADQSQYR
jgi:hypothetical protein